MQNEVDLFDSGLLYLVLNPENLRSSASHRFFSCLKTEERAPGDRGSRTGTGACIGAGRFPPPWSSPGNNPGATLSGPPPLHTTGPGSPESCTAWPDGQKPGGSPVPYSRRRIPHRCLQKPTLFPYYFSPQRHRGSGGKSQYTSTKFQTKTIMFRSFKF